MFIDVTMSTVEAEHRRQALLADAREHRLAVIAKAGRRSARQAAEQAVRRIGGRSPARSGAPPTESDRPGRGRVSVTAGKADAKCR